MSNTGAPVVDDSHSVRKARAQLFGDAGDAERAARDGFDASEQWSRERADVALSNLAMPNLNGPDMTRRLRENADWRATRVLAIALRGTNTHYSGAARPGVDAYLTNLCTHA